MAHNIDQGFGITLEGAWLPKAAPFSIGAEFAYNGYGQETTRQQFEFDDGTVTETNVIVTNTFSNLFITGKFFLRKEEKFNSVEELKDQIERDEMKARKLLKA